MFFESGRSEKGLITVCALKRSLILMASFVVNEMTLGEEFVIAEGTFERSLTSVRSHMQLIGVSLVEDTPTTFP